MRRIISIFILIILTGYCFAFNISASIDRNKINIDETLTYTVSISAGQQGGFPEPQLTLEGFNIVSRSVSQSISIINFQVSAEHKYTYILMPKKPGKFRVGPAQIKVNNQVLKSQIYIVEVTGEKTYTTTKKNIGNLYAELTADKRVCYINEPVILTFKFYTRVNLWKNPSFEPSKPDFCWTENLPQPRPYRKVINGRQYIVYTVPQLLFPLKTGKIKIPPASITAQISPFDRAQKLVTNSLTIKVMGLPNKTAVGDFKIKAQVSKTKLRQNTPLTLKLTVSGEGNIRSIEEPLWDLPMDFEIISKDNEEKINKNSTGITGEKIFTYTIIPRFAGNYILGPFKIRTFNYKTKKSLVRQASAKRIKVIKNDSASGASQRKIIKLKENINYIFTDDKFLEDSNLKIEYAYISIILLNILILILSLFRKIERKNTEKFTNRTAYKKAIKIINSIKTKSKDIDVQINKLEKGLREYFSVRFGKNHSEIDLKFIEEILKENKELFNKVKSFYDEIMMLRFLKKQKLDLKKLKKELLNLIKAINKYEN